MTVNDYQLRLIQSLDELKAIEFYWKRLWQNQGHVFQSFEWLYTWAKHYQPWIAKLYIITIWQQHELVAALPCYIRKVSRFGISQQQLWLMGTGEPEHSEVCAEYLDILMLPQHEAHVLTLLASAISDNYKIDTISFYDVKADSKLNTLISVLGQQFSVHSIRKTGHAFAIPLIENKPSFIPSVEKKLKRLSNKLDKLPHQLIITKDPITAERLFSNLIALHQYRWQKINKAGVFASNVFLSFHRSVLTELLQSNQLLIAGLEVAGKIIAVHYCYLSKKECWFYQSGISTDFSPNLSPGLLLHYLLAKHCAENGLTSYDLMKSTVTNDYKSELCQVTISLWQHQLHRNAIAALRFWLIKKLLAI